MVKRLASHLLIRPEDVPPSLPDWEVIGARVLQVGCEPILEPELDFEREGFVNDVVFPTGVIEADDRLRVYYGASDRYTGVAELSRAALLAELTAPGGTA